MACGSMAGAGVSAGAAVAVTGCASGLADRVGGGGSSVGTGVGIAVATFACDFSGNVGVGIGSALGVKSTNVTSSGGVMFGSGMVALGICNNAQPTTVCSSSTPTPVTHHVLREICKSDTAAADDIPKSPNVLNIGRIMRLPQNAAIIIRMIIFINII